ncbi:LacI family DNA-binding transcriptional regulator [uncultured Microbulbifer sp.]|uniref:LacI family DNA-binding transcriptional regulator n=1 Tax=uncultured Microbulbifer sp. TaxID=348147 RepID=UPI00260DF381|nr:LacI family DNA-binding transcriptional regulator [uncultured Microbulbifer sp.]
MKVTINDVAERAGVSIKTVSRVINNEPSVRSSTRERVMNVVQALNYHPNLAARNLAGTHSYSIAFIYDNPNAYYVIDMQNGILEACRTQGYELLIHPGSGHTDSIHRELRKLVEQSRVAGLVLTPPFSETPAVIDTLTSLDVEFVRIISAQDSPQLEENCIHIDDEAAAFAITQHLLQLGHKHIGYLCGGTEHYSTLGRLAGYRRALREAGLPFESELVKEGEYSFDSGVAGATALLHSPTSPTAIFAGNDEIAAGALFAARMLNIEVPQQLSIAGFEDSPFSRQTWPKLTTAQQPNEDIARCAAELVLERIQCRGNQEKDQQQAGRKTTNLRRSFTPTLVVRDSSGPVAERTLNPQT